MKQQLLNRLVHPELNKYIFLPLDFGFYKQPQDFILNVESLMNNVTTHSFGSPLMHKGLVKTYGKKFVEAKKSFFLHITGSTSLHTTTGKSQISQVKDAVDLGAIGVSLTIYLGNSHELEMLEMLGKVCSEADKYNLLVYAMMYVVDVNKQGKLCEKVSLDEILYAARVGYEIGVDIVETRLPEKCIDFSIVKKLCPVPIVLGDRSNYSEKEYVESIQVAVKNGYDGVSISNRSLKTPFSVLSNLTTKGFSKNMSKEQKVR